MSVYQCPKCALRYTLRPELEYHCREEHPDFIHDYPTSWAHPEDKIARATASERPPARS